jgi:hypothetical protein
MVDVRNAIANILDRYTLADIVEITLRKMRRNKIPLPFVADSIPVAGAPRRANSRNPKKTSNGARARSEA